MPAPPRVRSVVITGCSTGFGRVTALHLARRGWRVYATVRKEADRGSLLAEAESQCCREQLAPLLCDITSSDQVQELGRAVADQTSALDALVNNAGTAFAGPMELIPPDVLRAQLEVNVVAHLAVTQTLMPLLKRAGGTIVNVSSVSGRITSPLLGPYSASKFALEAMSDAMRVELAPFGVKVVIVEAGASPTSIWETSRKRAVDMLAEHGADVSAYARLIAVMEKGARKRAQAGFPPQVFAEAVEKILNSSRPRSRYAIPGRVAWAIRFRRFAPDWLWDWMVRRYLKW